MTGRATAQSPGPLAAAIYTGLSLLAVLVFLLVTFLGDYPWVARIGGSLWIFALMMIILMPIVTPLVRARLTGEKPRLQPHDRESHAERREEVREMARDPVCGMDIDPKTAAGSSQYKGQTHYFCNLNCKKSFDEDPARYVPA